MAQRRRYQNLDDIGQLARQRAAAGLSPEAVAARDNHNRGEGLGGSVGAAAAPGRTLGAQTGDQQFPSSIGRQVGRQSEGGLGHQVGGEIDPDFSPMRRRNAGYEQQGRAQMNTRRPFQPTGEEFGNILSGPDNTLKRFASQFAQGGGNIGGDFAQGVANQDPATQAFVNNVNLRDYLSLAGNDGTEELAGLVQSGNPQGLAALEALRRLGGR